MAAIDQTQVEAFVLAGENAASTTGQGKALEDLVCYVFGCVPGISVTLRNQTNVFASEEVDVGFFNDCVPGGLPFLPEIILVEAKNWSHRVGSSEVAWFDTKVRHRGLSFGILITTIGITGNPNDLTAAHHTVSLALADRRRLIVITVDEIRALTDTDQLVTLIKTKLCALALRGTIA